MNKQRSTKALKSTVGSGRGKRRANEPAVVSAEARQERQEEVARKGGARMRGLRLGREMAWVKLEKAGGLSRGVPAPLPSLPPARSPMGSGRPYSAGHLAAVVPGLTEAPPPGAIAPTGPVTSDGRFEKSILSVPV